MTDKTKKKYNYTKKTGKPTSYRPEYCQGIINFFANHQLTRERVKATGKDDYMQTEIIANEFPTLTDYSKKIGVSRSCITDWAIVHPDFAKALKEAKEIQHEIIIKCALAGHYNASFSIFTMKNVAGWRDQQEVKHSGNIDLASIVQETAKIAKK